jgi:hypothetical protein
MKNTKRVLIVLSEWGFWGEELIGPLETFDKASTPDSYLTGEKRVEVLEKGLKRYGW